MRAMAALSLACFGGAAPAHAREVIVMLGESTTYGQDQVRQSPLNAGLTLERLLYTVTWPCSFARLPVRNWAIPATTTRDWFVRRPSFLCRYAPRGQFPLLDYACDHDIPLAHAVKPMAAERGDQPVIVLINAQGTNDAHQPRSEGYEVAETVRSIARWPELLAPIPVRIAPPFNRRDAVDGPFVRVSGLPASYPAWYVRRVRAEELRRGLVTGPDWGVLMPNPPMFDGLHLTDSGYAAAGAFWIDNLCPR
jgi:hypothetical protein